MSLPRILAIMGSGETAPTMKAPHRAIFERIGGDHVTGRPVRAVMLDTPFGFQENAPILAEKTTEYFKDSVFRNVEVARLGRTDTGDVVAIEAGIARVRAAEWLFAGPGSPTFALRQWAGTPIPDLIAGKLRSGGAVVFSSAAALTVGVKTVPVYEVYKVGTDPFWLDGLDLLAEVGIDAAVIPHYNNTEGGNHDTRFCYLGERRLAMLEPQLPDGSFVLGVDEHTGIIMDLEADSAEIVGRGVLTVRRQGRSVEFPSGEILALDVIRSGGDRSAGAPTAGPVQRPAATESSLKPEPATQPDSLEAMRIQCEHRFRAAIDTRDAEAAVEAILSLESGIVEWGRDTLQSDQAERARASLRSMIVELGEAAVAGLADPRAVLAPVVEAALSARRVAREEKAWAVSDAVRDGLEAAGIEVRDTPEGVAWLLR